MPPITMSRIDLRNRSLNAAQLRAVLPRGGVDVDTVLPKVRPIVDAVAERGAEAALEYGESFDGVRPAAVRVPGQRAGAALDRPRRRRPRGAGGRHRACPRRPRRPAAHRHHHHAGAGRHRHRTLGTRRTRRALRPGGNAVYPSSVVMNVVPAQTAGRGVAGDRQPAAGRLRWTTAPDHPGRGRALGRRRGMGGRWRAGRGAARLRRHRHRRQPSWRPST